MVEQHMFNICKSEKGFSLIELMISLVMASIVIAAIYNTTAKQQDIFVDQDLVVSMQDNLRAAMLVMTSEVRMAGYDPTGLANASVYTASSNTMSFTMDLNSDGDINVAGEDITYSLYTSDSIQKLGRRNPTLNRPVAEYISNLEFYYTMADGTKTAAPVNLSNIRSVQITVLASTVVSTSNTIGQTSFTTPSGDSWTIANGFRGRMQTATVKFRNMGL